MSRVEALTVAMALAPGVYSRNRMFDLFAKAGVQRAKTRAAMLRGVVKHLGRACAVTLSSQAEAGEARGAPGGDFVLRYEIPAVRLTRVVQLSRLELATLRILGERANAKVTCLPPDDDDREVVNAALTRLLTEGAAEGGASSLLVRAARDVATATPPGD